MGILDDLREQANEKQVACEENSLLQEKREHNYQQLILPAMQKVYSYFKELIDYLGIIETPISIAQYSKRYSGLGELYQQDYRLSTDKHGGIAQFDKLTEISLRFNCLGSEDEEGDYLHTSANKIEALQEKEFLSRHSIVFSFDRHLGNTKEGAITFHIKRKIPVFFKFSVDYEKSLIILNIQNHEDFELRTQHLNPDRINEQYLDKLARYILRKDNEFIRIEIDDETKENIRKKLEAHKKAQREELEAAQLQQELEQQLEAEKKMSHKVKNKLKSLFNKT